MKFTAAFALLVAACAQTPLPSAIHSDPAALSVVAVAEKKSPRPISPAGDAESDLRKPTSAWVDCTITAAHALALASLEPPESLVFATFGVCAPQEDDYFQAALRAGLSVRATEDLKRRMRAVARDQIIAHIVAARVSH